MRRIAAYVLTAGIALAAPPLPAAEEEFVREHAAWRQWRLERLTSETSWLTLVGLHWLEPGPNALGSAPGTRLLLPPPAPARAGEIRLAGGEAILVPAAGSGLTIGGAVVAAPTPLATDRAGQPTLVELGAINFYVLERGDRFGLRVRDREAKLRREFPGLDYFPPDPRWRLTARFTAHPPGTTVPVASVLGTTEAMPSPGTLEIDVAGATYRLTTLDDTGDGRLFLIVGDRTNGVETYGAGRYLYADPPRDGVTVVDLNRLYNPPCAFTAYSTCQLPPRENKLPLRIEAGEKKFVPAPRP